VKHLRAISVFSSALLFFACSDSPSATPDAQPDATPDADTNVAPVAPNVLTPEPNRIDIIGADLRVTVSPFEDPDGNGQSALEVEVWLVSPSGVPTSAIWNARVTAGAEVTAGDGAFISGITEFDEWTNYAIHARYWDDSKVPKAGEWSEFRKFKTDDGSTELFAATTIRDVYLTIPPASADKINQEAYTAEGQVFEGVGVHVKGGCGSGRDLNTKNASLKVSLSWDDPSIAGCPATRRWRGQKTLTFNQSVQDPSLTHERVGYAFLQRLGVAVPRITPIRMHVNGEYWGVYHQLETIDRRFLERRFTSSRGMLYEGAYWCELEQGNLPNGNADDRCLRREFKTDVCDVASDNEPTTYDSLRDLIARLDAMPENAFYPAINEFFDYETFLSQWAAHAIMGDWDAYVYGIRNNYRVYLEPVENKWHMIPTGIDQTFGSDLSAWGTVGRLTTQCLRQPACEQRFVEKLNEALTVFEGMQLNVKAEEIYNQIKTDVFADPTKEMSNETFTNYNVGLRSWILARPAVVRADMRARGF
jgi:CotH kinase protein